MQRPRYLQSIGIPIVVGLLQMGSIAFEGDAQSVHPAAPPGNERTLDCSSGVQTFPVPFASEDEAMSDEDKPTIRAGFVLNSSLALNVTEHAFDNSSGYGTAVTVIHKDGREDHYQIAKLTRNSDLRLVHAAEVCSGLTDRTLVLEYEGNSTGGIEGFALIRYSSSGDFVDVYTLPIAQQGKVVVFKDRLNYVQVWTTAPGGGHHVGCVRKAISNPYLPPSRFPLRMRNKGPSRRALFARKHRRSRDRD